MPRTPLLGYLQSAVDDNTAHSQMDKLLFEDEMSNIQPEWGTMREYQEGYDPAKSIAEGDFLPPVGMAKAIYKTSEPVWKYATGESMLEGMEQSIKENIPEVFEKSRKWITGRGGASKISHQSNLSKKAVKELEDISKNLHNIKLDLPKPKPKSSADIIKEARKTLDINIAEGLSQSQKFGNMSPLQENIISSSVKNLERAASKWLQKPNRKFENIQKTAMNYFKPYPGFKPGQYEKWSDVAEELNMYPPPVQMKILGPENYKNYEIWNTLIGKTGNWGAARGNLKLKPDVLNPNIVPVNKRRPK